MNWENQDLFGQTVWCLLLWLSLAWVSSLPLVSWKLEGICRPTLTSKVWTVHLLPKIVLPVQRTECLHLATEPHSQEIYLWHASSLSDLKENFRIQGPFPWYSLTLSQTIGHHVERATFFTTVCGLLTAGWGCFLPILWLFPLLSEGVINKCLPACWGKGLQSCFFVCLDCYSLPLNWGANCWRARRIALSNFKTFASLVNSRCLTLVHFQEISNIKLSINLIGSQQFV